MKVPTAGDLFTLVFFDMMQCCSACGCWLKRRVLSSFSLLRFGVLVCPFYIIEYKNSKIPGEMRSLNSMNSIVNFLKEKELNQSKK